MSIELKAEEKQRIEEEELKRVVEERYRAEVRAGQGAPAVPVRRRSWLGMLLFCVVCLVAAVAVTLLIQDRKAETARQAAQAEAARIASIPKIHYVPVSKPMISGQLTLGAGAVRVFKFTISPDMKEAHVVGRFTAGGTNGADIEALLTSEDEFPNWEHGHQSKVLYSTNGAKTTDRFDVALDPGNYVLIFSNRSALLFTRYVTPEVELKYTRAEAQ